MKNLFVKAVLTGMVVFFATAKLSAQAPTGPYIIKNQNSYLVNVRWILENSSCSNACATSGGVITIYPGTSIVIPAPVFNTCNPGPACNLIIKLFDSCGTLLTHVDTNTQTNLASGVDCTGTAYSYNVTWGSTLTTIQ